MGKNTNIAMEYVIRQTGPYKKQCIALEKIFLTKKKNYLKMLMEANGSFMYWEMGK